MTQLEKMPDKLQRQAGMRLDLETGMPVFLTLDSQRDSENQRLRCEVIGLAHLDFFILRLPPISGLRQHLLPGGRGTLRLVSKGELLGFRVEVISHVVKPAFLLFLTYPDSMESLSLRQHRRVSCALPTQVHSRRGDGVGIIQDLSSGGCRMGLDVRGQAALRQMTAGDELLLKIPLDAELGALPVTSVVRSVAPEISRLVLGLSFTESDAEFKKALLAYMDLFEILN